MCRYNNVLNDSAYHLFVYEIIDFIFLCEINFCYVLNLVLVECNLSETERMLNVALEW